MHSFEFPNIGSPDASRLFNVSLKAVTSMYLVTVAQKANIFLNIEVFVTYYMYLEYWLLQHAPDEQFIASHF